MQKYIVAPVCILMFTFARGPHWMSFGVGFAGSPDADLYVGVSNLYLLMAEIMGVFGVLAFAIVIIAYLANLFGAWRRTVDPRQEALLLGLLAAVTGALVGGLFDHYLFNLVYPHMGVMLWSYIGLGMAVIRVSRPETGGTDGAPGRASLPVSG